MNKYKMAGEVEKFRQEIKHLRKRLEDSKREKKALAEEITSLLGRVGEAAKRRKEAEEAAVAAADAEKKRAEELWATTEELKILKEDLEKKVQERTAELQRDITKRKKAEEQIKRVLKEKEMLLKEIHHRVKNNLQIISSLINLQVGGIEKDKYAREMLKGSQNRILSIALIHEKLYQSKDLARIDFAKYIRDLTTNLFSSYGVESDAITLKINVSNVFLDLDTAIPCGLIINELVSNSLRHAFSEDMKGEIQIELYSDKDNKFNLIVRDNGVGFPKDLDFRSTKSLGLQLVITLTNQLRGTIELNTCPPGLKQGRRGSGGTTFKITFKEPKYKERS